MPGYVGAYRLSAPYGKGTPLLVRLEHLREDLEALFRRATRQIATRLSGKLEIDRCKLVEDEIAVHHSRRRTIRLSRNNSSVWFSP